MAHDPYRTFQTLFRFRRHFGDAIPSIHDKPSFRHIDGIDAPATAQFQYCPARRQKIKKGGDMSCYVAWMIVDIVIGFLLIESQSLRIKSVHIVGTGTSPE